MKKEEYSLITKKYAKNIWRKYIKCVEEYNLLAKGDIVFIYAKGLDKSNEHLCQMLLTMSSEFKMYDIITLISFFMDLKGERYEISNYNGRFHKICQKLSGSN